MEEHQFEQLVDLLESINDKLDTLVSNSSPVWNAHDVCQRLDDLISIMDR